MKTVRIAMRAVLAFLLMRSDTYHLQLALGEDKDKGERKRGPPKAESSRRFPAT